MGIQSSKGSSMLSKDFIKNLPYYTPLSINQKIQYQVHQILSHSPEHHHSILERIRLKKSYNSPFIIKILDSHTVESHSFCSNIIKTFLMVEKPQSLSQTIKKRAQTQNSFKEHELWLLLFSCCSGVQFLIENNIAVSRLTTENIFIDFDGNIKIADPQLYEGLISGCQLNEHEVLRDLGKICKELLQNSHQYYSSELQKTLTLCVEGKTSMEDIINYFNLEYMGETSSQASSPSFSLNSFSTGKRKMAVTLNRQTAHSINVTARRNQSKTKKQGRINTSYSYKANNFQQKPEQNKRLKIKSIKSNESQNKQNLTLLTNQEAEEQNLGLFTFKDPLKFLTENNSQSMKEKEEIDHSFPKKPILNNRLKNKKESYEPLKELSIKKTISLVNYELQSTNRSKQSSHEALNPLVSFQVDQQTLVCEVSKDQNQYLLQLMNAKRMSQISIDEGQQKHF